MPSKKAPLARIKTSESELESDPYGAKTTSEEEGTLNTLKADTSTSDSDYLPETEDDDDDDDSVDYDEYFSDEEEFNTDLPSLFTQ